MKIVVHPGRVLSGPCVLPGDKSISHRAILLAAMAPGGSVIDHLLVSGVTRPMLAAIRACGVDWTLDHDRLTVQSRGWRHWQPPENPLDCGNSATTLRLLAGALSAAGIPAVLDGSGGLRRRPMDRLLEPLRLMGAGIHGTDGHAPLTLAGRSAGRLLLNPVLRLPVASAQVKTALLLAGLAAEGPLEIQEPTLSRDHTERLFRGLGVRIETHVSSDGHAVHRLTPPPGELRTLHMTVPGDMSSAAFLIVAALITPGSEIRLNGVGLNPGRTGLVEALREMGAFIAIRDAREEHGEPVADLEVRHSDLQGIPVSGARVVSMIDEFPIFAVAAANAAGETVVSGAEELRHKESDRIALLGRELRAVGADFEERPDGFVVRGGPRLRGGRGQAHGDHRLAMSLAVAGLASAGPVEVEGAEMIDESFPGFRAALESLGATIEAP